MAWHRRTVTFALLAVGCTTPGTPQPDPAPPPVETAAVPGRPWPVRQVLTQGMIADKSRGQGAWLTSLSELPGGVWAGSRFPGRVYLYRDGALAGSSGTGEDTGIEGVVADGERVYFTDTERARVWTTKLGTGGNVDVVAGASRSYGVHVFPDSDGDGGPAAGAALHVPVGISRDPDDTLWITEAGSGKLRRIGPDRIISTVLRALDAPGSLARLPDGTLVIAETGTGRLLTWDRAKGQRTLAEGFDGLVALAVDRIGRVWVTDATPNRLWRLRADGGRDAFDLSDVAAPGGLAVGESLWVIDQGTNSVWQGAVPD